MRKNNEFKLYFGLIFIIICYSVVAYNTEDITKLSTILTTITAIIAAGSFWIQLERSKNLDEANFIMTLNDQFITNDEMTRIEHILELYYDQICSGEPAQLELSLDRRHPDCQRLINYLVYMEGLAALIKRDVMHLGIIDDLFAYRFFIAVNNPVVQEYELIPYADFYKGCYELSEVWTKQWRNEGKRIPLDQYTLFECDSRGQK